MDKKKFSRLKRRLENSKNLDGFKCNIYAISPFRFKASKQGFVKALYLKKQLQAIKNEEEVMAKNIEYSGLAPKEVLEKKLNEILTDTGTTDVEMFKTRGSALQHQANELAKGEDKAIKTFETLNKPRWHSSKKPDIESIVNELGSTLGKLATARTNLMEEIGSFEKDCVQYQKEQDKKDVSAMKSKIQGYITKLSQAKKGWLSNKMTVADMRKNVSWVPKDFSDLKTKCEFLKVKLKELYRAGHFLGKEKEYEKLMTQCLDQLGCIANIETNVSCVFQERDVCVMDVKIDEKAYQAACEKIQEKCDAINVDEDYKSNEKYSTAQKNCKDASDLYKKAYDSIWSLQYEYDKVRKACNFLSNNRSEIEGLSQSLKQLQGTINACELPDDQFQEVYKNACMQQGNGWFKKAEKWCETAGKQLSQLKKDYSALIEEAKLYAKTQFLHTPDISYETHQSRLKAQVKARGILSAISELDKKLKDLANKQWEMYKLTPGKTWTITDGSERLQNINRLGRQIEGIQRNFDAQVKDFRKTYEQVNFIQ